MSVFFMDFDMAPSVIWARDLYDQMQIQSDFRKWFPRMCQYGFVEGRDYEFVPRVRPQDEGGRTVQRYVKDYRITLEMAKQLYKLHHFHKNDCFRSCEGQHCMGADHWMLIVQDQVWNRVTINRNAKKNTRYYIDEFHLLLKEEQTAAYSVEIWKRFRKWGGIPTGITQNIKDLLASREIENIFENSDFIYMLNQASGDRQILAKQLNISPFQLSYVTNSNEGEGLLFYGNTIIPFKDKFDTSLKLYGLMTTKPNEIAKYREKKDA